MQSRVIGPLHERHCPLANVGINFTYAGIRKANRREFKSCLGQIFNFKLANFSVMKEAYDANV